MAEQRGGALKSVSLELLGAGRRLACELGVHLEAVLLGSNVSELAGDLFACGADRVFLLEHPLLEEYQTDCYTKVLTDLILLKKPEIVLIGSTTSGRDLAPRLSTRLRTGLMADCIDLQINKTERVLIGVKPVVGGNLLASITCPHHRPQIVTVRPRVLLMPPRDATRTGDVQRVPVSLEADEARTRVVATVKEAAGQMDLEEASVVVAAGRGVSCREDLTLVQELASVLGAALGATRPVVDAGLLPETTQIGQSGKTVRPKLYVACGIHGAAFHVVGMQNSDVIVAINDDPQAPIFKTATLGIVGDLHEIVPLLTERLRDGLAS